VTYVIYTFSSGDEPGLRRVEDGKDRVLWADEIDGGWGMSNAQEARVSGCDVVEYHGFLVTDMQVAGTSGGKSVAALVAAWDEARIT
jgi:hypothetical protein